MRQLPFQAFFVDRNLDRDMWKLKIPVAGWIWSLSGVESCIASDIVNRTEKLEHGSDESAEEE